MISAHKFPRMASLVLAVLLLACPLVGAIPVAAEGPNLLINPGFERPYMAMAGKENCRIAAPWVPYYWEGTPDLTVHGYRLAPEYKAAFYYDYPGNRVHSGELSQQYFHSYGYFEGGVLQQVSNIAVGSNLRFEIWAMTWSCENEKNGNCQGATSGNPSPMRLRIGIDPSGGTHALAPQVVWSPENNAYDAWTHFQVEAVATSVTVTVFVYAYPEYRSQDNNVYLDDASLMVVPLSEAAPAAKPAAASMPTLAPTAAPTATPAPAQTSQTGPAAAAPEVAAWPLTGTLLGARGGAFVAYSRSFAESTVTLKMWMTPYDAVIAKGVGFVIYGPYGQVASSTFAGTQGEHQATFSAIPGQAYLIQVYNYIEGLSLNYNIGQ